MPECQAFGCKNPQGEGESKGKRFLFNSRWEKRPIKMIHPCFFMQMVWEQNNTNFRHTKVNDTNVRQM